jgi:hypothetical protein
MNEIEAIIALANNKNFKIFFDYLMGLYVREFNNLLACKNEFELQKSQGKLLILKEIIDKINSSLKKEKENIKDIFPF